MILADLPLQLPLLNVYGAVVFSDTQLPLPMTEEQYERLLAITEDTNFIVGIVQPKQSQSSSSHGNFPIFQSGTAAQINGASEYNDSFLIVRVKGLCRFIIEEEFMVQNKYRYAKVSYNKYIYADSIPPKIDDFDKPAFTDLLKSFMLQRGITPDWNDLESVPSQELINFITMIGPLEASEKQAILEESDPNHQRKLLQKIISMSLTNMPSSLSIAKH